IPQAKAQTAPLWQAGYSWIGKSTAPASTRSRSSGAPTRATTGTSLATASLSESVAGACRPAFWRFSGFNLSWVAGFCRTLEAVPGVEAAGMATTLPMSWSMSSPINVEGAGRPEYGYGSSCDFVAGSYFRAMGVPLLRGRAFTERDNSTNAPGVAIVNEALV